MGHGPEDHGSGLLNGFQALAQEIGVSVPKLDVVQSIFRSPARLQQFLADHGHFWSRAANLKMLCIMLRSYLCCVATKSPRKSRAGARFRSHKLRLLGTRMLCYRATEPHRDGVAGLTFA
jgi:hypothetical protein